MLAIVQALGAVAGLASVVGLVVLSALYVSHARDVKRLRDWAGGAPEGRALGITVAGGGADMLPPAPSQITTTVSSDSDALGDLRPATAAGAAAQASLAPEAVEPTSSKRPLAEPNASTAAVREDTPIAIRRARPRRRRSGPRLAPALAGLLAAGGVVTYGASQMIGGDEGGHPGKTRMTGDGPSREATQPVAVNPSSVTVAVLNGTTVDGLAAALRDQVAAAGYRKGTIDVFSNQQLAASVVEYAPGHLAAAKAVGRVLAIGRYQPVTANSRALAADATVIVVAGADKASASPSSP